MTPTEDPSDTHPSADTVKDEVAVEAALTDDAAPPQDDPELRRQANRAILTYGLARLGLFLLLTVVIQGIAMLVGAWLPLVMSALLALIVAFPLSMLIFPKMRADATTTVALWAERRRQRKAWIRRELEQR